MLDSLRILRAVVLLTLLAPTAAHALPPLFPAPAQVRVGSGSFRLDADTRIHVESVSSSDAAASLLADELGGALGHRPLAIVKSGGSVKGHIVVRLAGAPSGPPGAYTLIVSPDSVVIRGSDPSGCTYGAMALLQLFTPSAGGLGDIPSVTLHDRPFHQYRGIRSTLPRGTPRPGELTHDDYRKWLRFWGFCRLNHVWIQGCSWNTPMERYPELAWSDVLTREQADSLVAFADRRHLSMDGSIDWQWLHYHYRHLAEIPEGETWKSVAAASRKMSRVNPCPSNPETIRLLTEQMDDAMDVLTGDHFAVPMDEMYQDYHGSRWGVCPLCKDRDPVSLWAGLANSLIDKVLERGRTPILGGGMLMREHQGWYKDIYTAIDSVRNRDKVVIYNWSEGHIRRGAMNVGGVRLQDESFSATPFFRAHGFKDVVHLFAGTRWQGRPEMREVNGKLDCYGGFVSYYHDMTYPTMKERGAVARTVFTAQHLWSPDTPAMESEEDRRMERYGEAVADALFRDASLVDAIAFGRRAYSSPADTRVVATGLLGRVFSGQPDSTGVVRIELPVEEANPGSASLVLHLQEWPPDGDVSLLLNGHRVVVTSGRAADPIPLSPSWLRFGPQHNLLVIPGDQATRPVLDEARILIIDTP